MKEGITHSVKEQVATASVHEQEEVAPSLVEQNARAFIDWCNEQGIQSLSDLEERKGL